jgi:hypothetical protein
VTIKLLHGCCQDLLPTLPAESVQCVVTALTETQVAYIAGLIDGEGSVECQKQMQRGAATPIFTLRLSFTFATAEPITTVAVWLGMTPSVYPSTDPKRQPRWRLHIKNRIALPLLRRVMPYLILKRQQAALVIAIDGVRALHSVPRTVKGPRSNLRMPQAAQQQMGAMYTELRSLKSNKRPMACR